MTRDESKKLLMVIQAAYPNFNPPDKSIAVDTWQLMLADYSYGQVESAIRAYIRTDGKGYPPSIGQVIEKLQTLYGDKDSEINEIAAWGMVLKAIRNSGYHSEEEFDKLPPIVQKAIVSPAQLREWALMEDLDGTGLNVMQSNFMRTYRQEVAREKETQKLSPDLEKLVRKTAGALTQTERKEIPAKPDAGEWKPISAASEEKIRKAREKLGGAQGGG